ncbi:dihydroorotase [Chitinophaga cymbidii]|uniref:Dihydroorotase n=1 Tax=Chitinophaga cymbidii TaxID=1096750 RepID=A0A512RRC0_9BACT|nr:dihydroorotase [Chitinophaga cymbidii]GEP98224.1 dihydroorotase [Chitinophaga cymbidii]
MHILLKSARIVAPLSPLHGQTQDILIKDGIIADIADNITAKDARVIQGEHLHVSAGWMDVFAHFCDPGQEYKEDLNSGADAAARGGFTTVMIVPNTQPALHTKTQIEYVLSKTRYGVVNVLPIGAISKNLEGASLAEMYEMRQTGAVAFSDGLKPVQSSGILLKALQYVKAFNGTIIQIPDDTSISGHGLMHEGIFSTRLGMPGKPAIAEEIMVRRDIELAKYTDSNIHFTGVSTRQGIELIAAAKAQGLKVTCSVTPYHLLFTEADLMTYDSFLKVNPPLRSQDDVDALREAVQNGTVDCIATHHQPQDWDAKQVEFEYAKNGMIGLESCFSILRTALPNLGIEKLTDLLSTAPRKIFGLPAVTLEKGAAANLTCFEPDAAYTFTDKNIASKSKNTPVLGKALKGTVIAVINNKQVHLS